MTRRWPRIVVAALWLVLVLGATAAVAMDGNQWLTLAHSARAFYVAGVVDTWYEVGSGIKIMTDTNPDYAPGVVEDTFRSAYRCAESMQSGQVVAIVEKYMKDHPENWHYKMANNIFGAIRGICQQ